MPIRDLMSKNFEVLPDRVSASEACERLAEGALGVIVDEQGTPHSLVTAEDLRARGCPHDASLRELEAKLPWTFVIEYEGDAPASRPRQAEPPTDSGSHGVVVLDAESGVCGVVTFEAVLCSSVARAEGLTVVDVAGALGGDFNTEPALLICFACGFLNRIDYLDHKTPPPCKNTVRPSHLFQFPPEGGEK